MSFKASIALFNCFFESLILTYPLLLILFNCKLLFITLFNVKSFFPDKYNIELLKLINSLLSLL